MNSLDLRGIPCPQNSARAIMKLSMMDAGEILELTVDDGEPAINVPESLTYDGHEIIEKVRSSDGTWRILVKAGD